MRTCAGLGVAMFVLPCLRGELVSRTGGNSGKLNHQALWHYGFPTDIDYVCKSYNPFVHSKFICQRKFCRRCRSVVEYIHDVNVFGSNNASVYRYLLRSGSALMLSPLIGVSGFF